MVTLGLFFLTRFPDPSYTQLWVDGGPLVAARTVKVLVTICVLLLAILGLGSTVATKRGSIFLETYLSSLVATFGSGYSLLVIIGSFTSLIPDIGLGLLAILIYCFAIVGLTRVTQKMRTYPSNVMRKYVFARKFDFAVLGLISIYAVSVLAHGLVLETYSDVLQIYLPFFEYFESAGSSQAILEKPGFSSFLQLRGLGSHLSATSIGGWTSAQAGSLLALILIAVVVFWGISDYSQRIFGGKISKSTWSLAGGAVLAILIYYSSAEIHSKPHLVSFSLLTMLSASLPIAVNGSAAESFLFKKTSILASIAVCVVYPLNLVAVILIVFVNAIISWVFQKTLLLGQIVENLSWAALSTVIMYVTNLYFVGVFGTEPMIRSVKVGYIFDKFSSDSIWQALYSAQKISGYRSYFQEPFASEGLFSKESILTLINLFNTSRYIVFVIGAFFIVIFFWLRLRALILFLCGALIISAALGPRIFIDFEALLRDFELILGIAGLLIVIERCASVELSHRKLPVLFKSLFSPFFMIIVFFSMFAVASVVINQPSFIRLAGQGNLGIVLLPCAVVFPLVNLTASFTPSDLRRGIKVEKLEAGTKGKPGARIFFTTIYAVATTAIAQLIPLQSTQILLLVVVFISLILNPAVFRKWRAHLTRSQSLNELVKTFATTWIAVLIFFAAVGSLPTYSQLNNWTSSGWGKQFALDLRKLVGSTGHMADSSEVLGFHTKKDIHRCVELAAILPVGAKIFPVNGLQEFAVCQGTPGLNRGELIHHYDSILAPRFDEIMNSNIEQTLNILRKLNISYLVMLERDCKKFFISQNLAFDANSLSQFGVFGRGSDFVVFDTSFLSRVNRIGFNDSSPEFLVEYSRSCSA